MNERTPRRRSTTAAPAEPAPTRWDLPAVSESLNTAPRSLTDRLAGPGETFQLAEEVTLTLFPERQMLRFRSPLAELVLAPVTSLQPQADRLRVESRDIHHQAVALFDPQGGLIFTLQPNEAVVAAEPLIVAAPVEQPAPVVETTPAADREAASMMDVAVEKELTGSPSDTVEDERGERLVFTGRIGRVPELKTTAKGRKLVRIPLAVHEGEATSWHTIVFFDDLAERAATTLAKGELISVVGYKHVREIETKRGTKKQELIFAAALQGQKKAPTS